MELWKGQVNSSISCSKLTGGSLSPFNPALGQQDLLQSWPCTAWLVVCHCANYITLSTHLQLASIGNTCWKSAAEVRWVSHDALETQHSTHIFSLNFATILPTYNLNLDLPNYAVVFHGIWDLLSPCSEFESQWSMQSSLLQPCFSATICFSAITVTRFRVRFAAVLPCAIHPAFYIFLKILVSLCPHK